VKSYYSILFATIRPEIDEKISIGLLFWNDRNEYFDYSKTKLNSISKLMSDKSFVLLNDTIKNIETSFVKKTDSKKFSTDYVKYLSKYNNNILRYTTPKPIDFELNQINFKKLFSEYIERRKY
jgi:hypothetical protein